MRLFKAPSSSALRLRRRQHDRLVLGPAATRSARARLPQHLPRGFSRGGWAEGQRPRRSLGGSWGHSVRAAVIRRHPDFKEALAAHDIAEAQVLGDNRRGFLKALADAPNHLVVRGGGAAAVQPRQIYSGPIPAEQAPMTVPQVMVHTSPPPAVVSVVAQAIPNAHIRKMRAEWRAIQRHGGRNAAEGGPRSLPEAPHQVIDPSRTNAPAPAAAVSPMEVSPQPDLEPPDHPRASAPLPPALQPALPDRNFLGTR